jgi:hypothetical protein
LRKHVIRTQAKERKKATNKENIKKEKKSEKFRNEG